MPGEDASFFNDWGFPRDGGTRFHEGNDLFAANKAEVRAPVSGTVKFKTGALGGNQFTLIGSDGDGVLRKPLDSTGKSGKVQRRRRDRLRGQPGNAEGTDPHLHFGISVRGLIVNPHPR